MIHAAYVTMTSSPMRCCCSVRCLAVHCISYDHRIIISGEKAFARSHGNLGVACPLSRVSQILSLAQLGQGQGYVPPYSLTHTHTHTHAPYYTHLHGHVTAFSIISGDYVQTTQHRIKRNRTLHYFKDNINVKRNVR
jgi:hypothetical protein